MSLSLEYEKADQFNTFFVTKEMYNAIKGLPWVETAGARLDPGMDAESLKVIGKSFKIAYRGTNEVHQVREAFRFLAEGLAGLEKLSSVGGYLVNERCAAEAGRSDVPVAE